MSNDQQKPQTRKPLFLLQGSPLVSGGKARLMSNRKVGSQPAKPREVSGVEAIGYTTEPHKALREEPECIGPAIVDAYAELGKTFDELRRIAQIEEARVLRQALSLENRMLDARRRAKLQHIDLSHEMHIMDKMLGRGKDAAVVERLEILEARLDHAPDVAA